MRRVLVLFLPLLLAGFLPAQSQMEYLDRGLVALRTGPSSVFLGWRLLGSEPADTRFHLYRSRDGAPPEPLTAVPLTGATHFTDSSADASVDHSYYVRPIHGDQAQPLSEPCTLAAGTPQRQYLEVPIDRPADVSDPLVGDFSYSANDCSVGDLDGDGAYEIIVKWDPSNSKDSSQSGYTGNVYLDAYELDGTRLWRIDLGVNIRAGAHYTQFIVYDLDGDGFAELACKTADGTVSGTGEVIGNPSADHRASNGYILSGPEYLTLFDGRDGSILATTDYEVPRGDYRIWKEDGRGYGNRVDRFLAAPAYLDGERPSLVMCRGYYTRSALAAYDWRDGQLTQRWVFDTTHATSGPLAPYRGQGAHSLCVGDVDQDGRDEIVYGACTIDDDGSGLYSTELGHGDALHLSDMDPTRPGLEVWMVHESPSIYGDHASELHDAATGEILYSIPSSDDVGRGVAADIDPRHLGYETWSSRASLHNVDGTEITGSRPGPMNFLCWWDGDLLRELLDGTTISKWDWQDGGTDTLLSPGGVSSNNTTKANPCLSADLFGDWREEVVWRTSDSRALRIYTTTIATSHRIPTLMHDRTYRCAIAWQNVAYNQPPHPGYYLGEGMAAAPRPPLAIRPAAGAPAPLAERFPAWLAARGLDPALSPELDHDGNGRSLLAEYAFDHPDGPPLAATRENDGTLLGFLPARDEFDYQLESSTNLVDWTPLLRVPGRPADSAAELLEVLAPGDAPRTFYRVAALSSFEQTDFIRQAEDAAWGPHAFAIESRHPGFHGSGYINFDASSYLEFAAIDGGDGGTAVLAIRYALGTATRSGLLIVNGVEQALSFPPSGSWDAWSELTLQVPLNAGTGNTIRIESTGNDLANIDQITVTTGR